jgi:hypothetical protein
VDRPTAAIECSEANDPPEFDYAAGLEVVAANDF